MILAPNAEPKVTDMVCNDKNFSKAVGVTKESLLHMYHLQGSYFAIAQTRFSGMNEQPNIRIGAGHMINGVTVVAKLNSAQTDYQDLTSEDIERINLITGHTKIG